MFSLFRLATPLLGMIIPIVTFTTLECISYFLITQLTLPNCFELWVLFVFFAGCWSTILGLRLLDISRVKPNVKTAVAKAIQQSAVAASLAREAQNVNQDDVDQSKASQAIDALDFSKAANIYELLESFTYQEHQEIWFFKGTATQFRLIHWTDLNDNNQLETIIHSAIRHPDDTIYSAKAPGRHHHVIGFMAKHKAAGLATTHNQGFITSSGRYVDRKEALIIATKAKQILKKTQPDYQLFSEDVWNTPPPKEKA